MVRTYAEAGVDIEAKRRQVNALVRALAFRRRGVGKPLGRIGAFTGLIDLGTDVLGMCTDSVGTKVLVAAELGRWETIGIDCVAMNANDMITAGIEPLAFVDYLAVSEYDEDIAHKIGIGLNRGAERANVTVVGGEIAVVPELVRGYDLAGTCVGFSPRKDLVDPKHIRTGDLILGVESSGIHSNGLTLARRVFRDAGLSVHDRLPGASGTVGEVLLEPTAIYVREVLKAIREHTVHGMAHITGGGLRNLLRLKRGLEYRITNPLSRPRVFQAIQDVAGVADEEMYQTFNMGMGYAIVAPEGEAEALRKALRPLASRIVGRVQRGDAVTLPELGLSYAEY